MPNTRYEHETVLNQQWLRSHGAHERSTALRVIDLISPSFQGKVKEDIISFILEFVVLFPGDAGTYMLFLDEIKRRLEAKQDISLYLDWMNYILRESAAVGYPSVGMAFSNEAQRQAYAISEQPLLCFSNMLALRIYIADQQLQAKDERVSELENSIEDIDKIAEQLSVPTSQLIHIYKATLVSDSVRYAFAKKHNVTQVPDGIISVGKKDTNLDKLTSTLNTLDLEYVILDEGGVKTVYLYIKNDLIRTALMFIKDKRNRVKEVYGSMFFSKKGKVTKVIRDVMIPGYYQRQETSGVFFPDYDRVQKLVQLGEALGKSMIIDNTAVYYDRGQTAQLISNCFKPFEKKGVKTCLFLQKIEDPFESNFRLLCEQALGLYVDDIVTLVRYDLAERSGST